MIKLDDFQVLKPLIGQVITVDDNLRLSIEISDPDKVGIWYKNGVPIDANDKVKKEVNFLFNNHKNILIYNFLVIKW